MSNILRTSSRGHPTFRGHPAEGIQSFWGHRAEGIQPFEGIETRASNFWGHPKLCPPRFHGIQLFEGILGFWTEFPVNCVQSDESLGLYLQFKNPIFPQKIANIFGNWNPGSGCLDEEADVELVPQIYHTQLLPKMRRKVTSRMRFSKKVRHSGKFDTKKVLDATMISTWITTLRPWQYLNKKLRKNNNANLHFRLTIRDSSGRSVPRPSLRSYVGTVLSEKKN